MTRSDDIIKKIDILVNEAERKELSDKKKKELKKFVDVFVNNLKSELMNKVVEFQDDWGDKHVKALAGQMVFNLVQDPIIKKAKKKIKGSFASFRLGVPFK